MQSKNRIYIFFIGLALVFWNPLSFYIIYGNTPVYSFKLIHFFFWTVFIAGVCIEYFLYKNKIGRRLSNLCFSFGMAGILFSLIVLADAIIGLSGAVKERKKEIKDALIFEPHSRAIWQTTEFNYTVDINSLGLRDKEINANKGNHFRILCFGDSWTFGWGVNVEDSWPGKLESFLRAKGIQNIEVINCGQPGRYTSTYKTSIEKAVSILKPDLVLLGVLQLDDLAQIYENAFPETNVKKEKLPVTKKVMYAGKTFLKYSCKNILTLIKRKPQPANITKSWKEAANSYISRLTTTQMNRFNTLQDSVKLLLQNGNLHPGFLHYFFNCPDRVFTFNDPANPNTQFALAGLNKDIEKIKSICTKNGAELLFINLPTHPFTGHHVISGPRDSLNSWLENNNHIDSMYRSVAERNAVPYFELTDSFRALPDKSAYFFRFDAHPTVVGYQKIADLIGLYLIDAGKFSK